MTKLMSQGLYLQYKASSGVYYSHGDCEGPSDMAPSSNYLLGSQGDSGAVLPLGSFSSKVFICMGIWVSGIIFAWEEFG